MRLHTFFKAIPVAVLMLTISTTAFAQTTIWELQSGDVFRVQTIVERKNTVQLDETDESVRNTTDTLILEYKVLSVLAGGNVSIRVRVIQADRKTDEGLDKTVSQQLPALRKIVVIATVDPDGIVQDLSEYDNAINQLLQSHQSGRQLMEQSVSREVFTSWISYPFWLPAAEAKSVRNHDISLGLLGQLQTIITCESGTLEEEFAKVTITGDFQDAAPTSLGHKASRSRVAFTDIQATLNSFRGQGTIAVPPKEEVSSTDPVDEPPQAAPKRPLFESMTLELSCSGEATLKVADSQRRLRFQQQQKITSKLMPGYRMGQRSRFPLFIRP